MNSFAETEPSPLADIAQRGGIVTIDPEVEREQTEAIRKWRAERDNAAVDAALARLRDVAATTENLVPATIDLAHVGGTVGEWAGALRDVFGKYRGPTGIGAVHARVGPEIESVRERVLAITKASGGRPIRLLVGKPGLDGHSNGAEQIAGRGPRRRHGGGVPGDPPQPGRDRGRRPRRGRRRGGAVDSLGLPSGAGAGDDRRARGGGGRRARRGRWHHPGRGPCRLEAMGVAHVYTPKDFRMAEITADIAELARAHRRGTLRRGRRRADENPHGGSAPGGGRNRRFDHARRGRDRCATSTPALAVVAGIAGVIAAVAGVALAAVARRNGEPARAGRGRDPHGAP